MRHIINALENLWLSSNEVQIYLTSLEYWWLTALGISRLTKLPRTSIYMLLEKLEEKWFFHVKKNGSTSVYNAISWDEVLSLLDKQVEDILWKKKEISNNLYVLNNITKARTQLPHIQFYDWDSVQWVLMSAVQHAKNVKIIYHIQKTMFVDSDSFFDKLLSVAKVNNVHTQVLLADSQRAHDIIKKEKYNPIILKSLPTWFFFFSQQILTDLWYYHITYWDKIYLMEIIDPLYINAQKTQFDILRNTI